MIDIIDALL